MSAVDGPDVTLTEAEMTRLAGAARNYIDASAIRAARQWSNFRAEAERIVAARVAAAVAPEREATKGATKYLAQMDQADGDTYTADFRDGFRHALAMLAAFQEPDTGGIRPEVREAARAALARHAAAANLLTPTLPGYYIDPDANDTPTLWHGARGDAWPRAVVNARQVDAAVWDVLVKACGEGS